MSQDPNMKDSLPWYRRLHEVPPHLSTRPQLLKDGYELAKGQKPAAHVGKELSTRMLYDKREAVKTAPGPIDHTVSRKEIAKALQLTVSQVGYYLTKLDIKPLEKRTKTTYRGSAMVYHYSPDVIDTLRKHLEDR